MDLTTTFTLPRRTANELALAAVLAPLAVTDLRVPVASKIWALDASPTKGAYVSTPGTAALRRALWRHGERRGGYSRLETGARAELRARGELFPEAERKDFEPLPGFGYQKPHRELAMVYDVIEVAGGFGGISREMAKLGLKVGPIIDLTCPCSAEV